MKTKEEVIAEVYGEKYDWDENGWLSYGVDEASEFGYEPFGEYDKKDEVDGTFEWRPKSLQGFEYNNGWIKIESEKDLPIKCETKFSVAKDKRVFNSPIGYRVLKRWFFENKITHYQPIIKPHPPIF